jgi:hypothetical protein
MRWRSVLKRFDEDGEDRFRSTHSAAELRSETRWHVRCARNGHLAAQPIGGDCGAVHDPTTVGRRIGARRVTCTTVERLHNAAVDEDPGWIGCGALRY